MSDPRKPIFEPKVSPHVAGERKPRVRGRWLALTALLTCGAAGLVAWQARPVVPPPSEPVAVASNDLPTPAIDPAVESQIAAFCSDCHTLPRPENLPRDRWHTEVQLGYEFYARSGRNDLSPPPMHQVIAYFRSRAPAEVHFPQPVEARTTLRTKFAVEELMLDQEAGVRPEISHLRWTRLTPDGRHGLLFCDMRFGYVAFADLDERKASPQVLARLNHPCRAEPCDLDDDGAIDLVVADLGSSRPCDHDRGRVVWLRREKESGRYEERVLASGLGRVADVRPADFDRDGDLDLVVAEFGHYQTGGIFLCRNVAESGEPPRFEMAELDDRPGTIHVPVHDFNADGLPDFAALVSQEWEHVDAFINRGDGHFQLATLWAGPDLMFGSSGIELVDLDQDADMDVLYTNGDAWDNLYVSPSHGVQWLENLGSLRFAYHRLTDMIGAYRALAGDLDSDGDLDIVVVAWLPPPLLPRSVAGAPLASIVCLEQTEPGVFVRHTLQTGSPPYATFEMADFDGDGDLDFAVGPGPHVANKPQKTPWLTVWRNQGAGPGEK
ncbi:MAG: VCBS repeat-containing protein [Rhodopirellula sp.]|nr:VCBS repeat-containing protein [Rhodopirellula sp.]